MIKYEIGWMCPVRKQFNEVIENRKPKYIFTKESVTVEKINEYTGELYRAKLKEELCMSKNKGGRPPKYSYELLFDKLTEVSLKNKMGQINNSMLFRETGIPLHIWRDNKAIQNNIKEINSNNIALNKISDDLYELPNIVELVEHNFKNKANLIEQLRGYMDYVDTLYKKATEYDILAQERDSLKNKCSNLEKENKVYKDKIKKIAVASTSLKTRKELGLQKNISTIEGNKKKAGATDDTIENKFSDLFNL